MASSNSPVYTGAWTNWSDGRVLGATITMTSLHGSYLIAFLAIYVRIVASHFWDILCYLIFHRMVAHQPRDGLHYQQQALLANTLTDSSSIWQFARLGWYWRKRADNVFWRTLSFIILAILHFSAFTVAGIFTANVTSLRSEVLLKDSLCGSYTPPSGNPLSLPSRQADTRISAMEVKALRSAYDFATSCYDQTDLNASVLPSCNAYGPKNIDWSIEMSRDCPFSSEMCLDTQSVRFDTGYVNSALHLGVNSPPEDRVTYRNVLHCSPIKADGFTSQPLDNVTGLVGIYPSPGAKKTWVEYMYGENTATGSNATFAYTNESTVTSEGQFDVRSYILDMEYAYLGDVSQGTFIPIPQLNRTDADVILLFLMKEQTGYYAEVKDPWFKAESKLEVTEIEEQTHTFLTNTFWLASEPVGVLGCASQNQYCNPITGECTALSGQLTLTLAEVEKLFNPRQTYVIRRMGDAGHVGSLLLLASEHLGSGFMVASSLFQNTIGDALPDNQWVVELNHWMRIGYTFLQISMTWWVAGDGVAQQDQYKVAPTSPDETWMCSNQIVQRNDHSSFSILGIVLILVIGAIIIFGQLLLNRVLNFHRQRVHGSNVETPPWNAANILQVQRVAFEGQGVNVWTSGPYDMVPVTAPGQKFDDLRVGHDHDHNHHLSDSKEPLHQVEQRSTESSQDARQMAAEEGYTFGING